MKKQDYISLLDAIEGLKKKGYNKEFDLLNDGLLFKKRNLKLTPNDFQVDEMYRFEGMTNPSDSSILYAVTAGQYNIKGLVVDNYGINSQPLNEEMLERMRYVPGN